MVDDQDQFERFIDAADRRYGEEDYEGGLDLYERALRCAPDAAHRAEAFCGVGDALLALGRAAEAVHMFAKAVDLDPTAPGGWCGQADVAYDRWELERSLAMAEEALSRDPECARAHYLKALVHEKRGDGAAAARSFRRAARIDAEYYPCPQEIGEEEFERLVDAAVAMLPGEMQELLEEIDVDVEPFPEAGDAALYRQHHIGPQVPGLVLETEGAPAEPPRLTLVLYRRNLEKLGNTPEVVTEEIRKTILHELEPELELRRQAPSPAAAGDVAAPPRF